MTTEEIREVNAKRIEEIKRLVPFTPERASRDGRGVLILPLETPDTQVWRWFREIQGNTEALAIVSMLPKYEAYHITARIFGANPPKPDFGLKHLWVRLHEYFQQEVARAKWDSDREILAALKAKAAAEKQRQIDALKAMKEREKPPQMVLSPADGVGEEMSELPKKRRPLPVGPAPAMAAVAAEIDDYSAAAASCATVDGLPVPLSSRPITRAEEGPPFVYGIV